ncbi:hypothetical protein CHARACLAT_031018 [Characodon lateralis]|uniref:Uncharacterized protein n=1 Tax=Characodon lateralis TaxID=208331 RepID=A0ABU7DLN0_9TELE|nr:hypothetical protein [Characodon lateralis]
MTEAAQRDPNQEPEANSTGEPIEKVSRPGSSSSMFGEILAEETMQQAHADSATPSEMIIYISEPPISRSASSLEYWKANKECFTNTERRFNTWCRENNLCINVKKTKEMVVDTL